MNRLKNKVAIITGGAKGIGKATAKTFLKEGAKVVIWDLDTTAGKATAQSFQGDGQECLFMKVNTSDFGEVSEATGKVIAQYGQIDVLINNAGITRDASLKKMTPEQWQQVIDVNLTGVFNCTKVVSEHMVEQGSGRILNAASVVGLYGNFGQTNYVATKAGVIGMTKTWARELGRKGITVNAVAPGFIQTEMIGTVPEKVIETMVSRTPMARLGTVEDIANAYLFLASDEASFITGVTLSVDGGLII